MFSVSLHVYSLANLAFGYVQIPCRYVWTRFKSNFCNTDLRLGNISNICLGLGQILQLAWISLLLQLFPAKSQRQLWTSSDIFWQIPHSCALHSCTLSKLVAWLDPYISVVSLTTYTKYLCWIQVQLNKDTTEVKEHHLLKRLQTSSGSQWSHSQQ